MTTDYDPIAEQYQRAKQQPWRTHIEAHTLMELAGNLARCSVLDLACGDGFYSRLVKSRGAARVMGVDLSQGMIELARQAESRHSLGIEYRVGDAKEVALAEPFDIALAAYLFNYAHDEDELLAMCRGAAGALKPGGRLVAVNSNPAFDFRRAPSYRKYGFETSLPNGFAHGAPICWRFFLRDGQFDIENYYLDVASHEQAFRAAGFREIRWHPPRLSAESGTGVPADHWAEFVEFPPIAFVECVK
jgi:ubiquinone/menaquinone biosynthesis C-methylase UbiE